MMTKVFELGLLIMSCTLNSGTQNPEASIYFQPKEGGIYEFIYIMDDKRVTTQKRKVRINRKNLVTFVYDPFSLPPEVRIYKNENLIVNSIDMKDHWENCIDVMSK